METKKIGALEITINLFSFFLLWTALFATGSLLFDIINYYFPDPLANYGYGGNSAALSSSITYAIAAILVSLPLYIISIRYWLTQFVTKSAPREGTLSRFLTYFILLAVSLTIVGDLISLLYNFLQGEFGMRFVLKSLVVLVLALFTAVFYYYERRLVQYTHTVPSKTFKRLLSGPGIVAVLAIVLGFIVGGSPFTQRALRYDAIREQDMQSLESVISNYIWDTGRAPTALSELVNNPRYNYARFADPETGIPYGYKTIAATSTAATLVQYELCATFKLAAVETAPLKGTNPGWQNHTAGLYCQTSEANNQTKGTVPAIPVGR